MHRSFRKTEEYKKFVRYLQSADGNYHFLNPSQKRFLSRLKKSAESRRVELKKDFVLDRAKKGCHIESDGSPDDRPLLLPLTEVEMQPTGFPGRANASGRYVFYCATDAKTAISEIREWIGAEVTLGLFSPKRDLSIVVCESMDRETEKKHIYKILDLGMKAYHKQAITDDEIQDYTWGEISKAFSMPIQRDDSPSDYVPTQIMADLFRSTGFDGIAYYSVVGKGFTLAISTPALLS